MHWYDGNTKRKFFKTLTLEGKADLYLCQKGIKLMSWQIKSWVDNWNKEAEKFGAVSPKTALDKGINKREQRFVKMCTLRSRSWAGWEQKEMGGNVLIELRQ